MTDPTWTFLHAADLHLDAPLVGLDRYDGAPVEEMRDASRRALERAVDLACEQRVRLAVFAGDLFDGDWRDFNTGLFFRRQLARLVDAGARVFLVRGNHDAVSRVTRELTLPEGVGTFDHRRPETVVLDDLGVALHGQSYARREVTDNLAAAYPPPIPGLLNIGVLHTDLAGAAGASPYAPCSVDDLVRSGYQYWALGHMHTFEVHHRDPWVVMPGTIQGRHARETGPKGVALVTVADGAIARVEHWPVDVARWVAIDVDAGEDDTAGELIERFAGKLRRAAEAADGRTLAVRATFSGATRAHHELATDADRWRHEVIAAAADCGVDAWIEKVRWRTRAPVDRDRLAARDDAIGALIRALRDGAADAELIASCKRALAPLAAKLPPAVVAGDEPFDLADDDTIRRLVADAGELLLAHLVEGGR
ncbi:MAG: DNA repair exonuclease [Deltaproteobacteria bacterium]|nr:MAG: DNA repair exonuclease [Deltaproteobacteria bacterium]